MRDNRTMLYHQIKTIMEFVEENLYTEKLTEAKAKKSLVLVHQLWATLDRRA